MREITSKHNEIIVSTNKLKDKKYRAIDNEFLLEGEVMISDCLKAGLKILRIFINKDNAALIKKFSDKSIEIYLTTKEIIKFLSDTVTPQDAIAVVKMQKNNALPCEDRVLVLDNIQDPGNLGTIIRTAACVGIKQIYAINCVDAFNPKCIRSSKSGIFFVNVIATEYDELLEKLKQNNIPIVIADLVGKNVFGSGKLNKFALVIGNEANGVSAILKNQADLVLSIPVNNCMDSLNAGVAASIIMYQIF